MHFGVIKWLYNQTINTQMWLASATIEDFETNIQNWILKTWIVKCVTTMCYCTSSVT